MKIRGTNEILQLLKLFMILTNKNMMKKLFYSFFSLSDHAFTELTVIFSQPGKISFSRKLDFFQFRKSFNHSASQASQLAVPKLRASSKAIFSRNSQSILSVIPSFAQYIFHINNVAIELCQAL